MEPASDGASLTFVGTATTVLRIGGFTLMTDPNFLRRGQRAYLGYGLSTRRLTEPAMGPADLPSLDAVLLSHLHGDHFDRVARRSLPRDVPVVTTRQAARRLGRRGFHACSALRTWQSHTLERPGERLRVTAVPAVHGPGPVNALLPEVMGSVLEWERPGRPTLRLYVTGDTLYRRRLRELTERFPELDAMVVHLGGTRILGVLVSMDHGQGADLVDLLRPRLTVPVHLDDYGVFHSSPDGFAAEVRRRDLPCRVGLVGRGETIALAAGQASTP
ncbi:MAG TPA: MBL fold metallo-hydrolase [Pseudonocardiaceae bacterium]